MTGISQTAMAATTTAHQQPAAMEFKPAWNNATTEIPLAMMTVTTVAIHQSAAILNGKARNSAMTETYLMEMVAAPPAC